MDKVDAAWRKSSYSGANGGNCVEIADAPGTVLIRDSRDKDGARLAFSAEAWRAFAVKVKRSLAGPEPSV
jgi:hypothetical protein